MPRTSRISPLSAKDTGTISPGAKLYWKELAGLLEGARVLTDGDRRVLELACEALAQHRAATVALTSFGLTYTTESDNGTQIRARPEVGNRRCSGEARSSYPGRLRPDASCPDEGCRAAIDEGNPFDELMTLARNGLAGNEARPAARARHRARSPRNHALAPPHRVAPMGPALVREAARLICLQSTPAGLGYRESMRLLKHLHALHMTPLARAQACGHWPWQADPDGGGDDAA